LNLILFFNLSSSRLPHPYLTLLPYSGIAEPFTDNKVIRLRGVGGAEVGLVSEKNNKDMGLMSEFLLGRSRIHCWSNVDASKEESKIGVLYHFYPFGMSDIKKYKTFVFQ
jgi:hypothetical protein